MSFAQILDEELPAPPPSFAEIMKSFSKDGNGDAKTLLAILSAKQAEEDRLAKTLEIRIHLLQMHAQRLGMVPTPPSPRAQGYLTPPHIPSHKLYPAPQSPPYAMPTAREAANMRRHDSTSSSGSGSRVELSASTSPVSLTLPPITRHSEQDLAQLRLAPISPKSFPTHYKSSPTFTPLSLKRRLSEDDDDRSERSKRVRSTTLSDVEAATGYGSRKSSSPSSVVSGRSRSSSGGRMTNGLEMLLNAAEMEKK